LNQSLSLYEHLADSLSLHRNTASKKPHTKYTSSYMAFLILFLFTETPIKPENFTPYSALCLLLYCG
jgi:hypothetical protein